MHRIIVLVEVFDSSWFTMKKLVFLCGILLPLILAANVENLGQMKQCKPLLLFDLQNQSLYLHRQMWRTLFFEKWLFQRVLEPNSRWSMLSSKDLWTFGNQRIAKLRRFLLWQKCNSRSFSPDRSFESTNSCGNQRCSQQRHRSIFCPVSFLWIRLYSTVDFNLFENSKFQWTPRKNLSF